MTEELVMTVMSIVAPFRFQALENQPFLTTQEGYLYYKRVDPDRRKLGTIPSGSRVFVEQMFTHNGFNGKVLYSKLQVTNAKTNQISIIYASWIKIESKLKEVKNSSGG